MDDAEGEIGQARELSGLGLVEVGVEVMLGELGVVVVV